MGYSTLTIFFTAYAALLAIIPSTEAFSMLLQSQCQSAIGLPTTRLFMMEECPSREEDISAPTGLSRRNWFALSAKTSTAAAAVFGVLPSAVHADVWSGNELPPGAASFNRVIRLKRDLKVRAVCGGSSSIFLLGEGRENQEKFPIASDFS